MDKLVCYIQALRAGAGATKKGRGSETWWHSNNCIELTKEIFYGNGAGKLLGKETFANYCFPGIDLFLYKALFKLKFRNFPEKLIKVIQKCMKNINNYVTFVLSFVSEIVLIIWKSYEV